MTAGHDSLIFMFPGQSSRHPEMMQRAIRQWPKGAAILRQASDVLDRNIEEHYRADNADMFARNRDVQIGVFLANYIHMKWLEDLEVRANWSLGLSLGEYNHLVHAGALTFEQALILLNERGSLFDVGASGVMLSIFPLEAALIEDTIAALGLQTRVTIGLYNAPRQQVLSGDRDAVARVVEALEDEYLIQGVEIESSIQMHSPAFAFVAEKFGLALAGTEFIAPALPYVPNVTGAPLVDPTPEQIRTHLAQHVCRPVRWCASVDSVAALVPDAHFVEVGPGATLYNMFGRGWTPGRRSRTDNGRDLHEHLEVLTAELRNGS